MKESIDTSTPTGKLLFTLMSAIAQFERDVIADRTREGLNSARARGRTGGRPKTNEEQVKKAVKLYSTGQYTVREIEELMLVLRKTRYTGIYRAKEVDNDDEKINRPRSELGLRVRR